MKTLVKELLLNPIQRALTVAILVLVLVVGFLWLKPGPKPIVTQPDAKTTVVEVPRDVIVTKDVIKYVEDDKEVKRLLDENRKLKIQVTQLTEVIAKHKSTGSGTVTTVPVDTIPEPLRPEPTTQPTPQTAFEFKDWRLHFVASGDQAKYELNQKFEVLSTTGRDRDGKRVARTKLFEIGPGETRTEITDTKTTNIFADETRSSWHVGLTLQAGLGYVKQATTPGKQGVAAVVGVQWLKKGRTEAAEDSSLSVLTPVVTWAFEEVEVGVLPVSMNLGKVKFQPFKDLWVSPYVGWNAEKGTVGRIGALFTASF